MSEKLIKVKNVSRGNFHIALDFVTPGKYYDLKPNMEVGLTQEEYMYLSTACPGSFKKGFIKVMAVDPKADVEVIESENVMSNDDIEKLLDYSLPTLKKKLADIDSLNLLRDIRQKADDEGKKEPFMKAIDERIKAVSDGALLL